MACLGSGILVRYCDSSLFRWPHLIVNPIDGGIGNLDYNFVG